MENKIVQQNAEIVKCPKCGTNMVLKTVKGIRYDNSYYKCPKCHYLKVTKKWKNLDVISVGV